jgi:hypothetical protein
MQMNMTHVYISTRAQNVEGCHWRTREAARAHTYWLTHPPTTLDDLDLTTVIPPSPSTPVSFTMDSVVESCWSAVLEQCPRLMFSVAPTSWVWVWVSPQATVLLRN